MNAYSYCMDMCGNIIPEVKVITDKNIPIRTFLHYFDPQARETLTVFGARKPDLFYAYDDRLHQWGTSGGGERTWSDCCQLAMEELGITSSGQRTARFFEIALCHFHGKDLSGEDTVDLQHVMLGCNVSNGFSYLVFGYIYE